MKYSAKMIMYIVAGINTADGKFKREIFICDDENMEVEGSTAFYRYLISLGEVCDYQARCVIKMDEEEDVLKGVIKAFVFLADNLKSAINYVIDLGFKVPVDDLLIQLNSICNDCMMSVLDQLYEQSYIQSKEVDNNPFKSK